MGQSQSVSRLILVLTFTTLLAGCWQSSDSREPSSVMLSPSTNPDAEQTTQATRPSPTPVAPPTTSLPGPPLSDSFNQGLELAMSAAILGQSAQSPDDWGLVVSRWQRAIQHLKAVPAAHSNHALAQTKIGEYQRNLTYAQGRLNQLSHPPEPVPVARLNRAPAAVAPQLTAKTVDRDRNSPQPDRVPILRRLGGTPVIEVTFNGSHRFPMILDTGASHTHITRNMANQLGVVTIGETQATTASNQNVAFEVGEVESMSVAGIQRTQVRVSIGDAVELGLLGNDFYANYDIVLTANSVEFRPRF